MIFLDKFCCFFINFGEMYLISVSSTTFVNFLELIANFWISQNWEK